MEDKKQDEKLLEKLVKTVDSYRDVFVNLADELAKVLADIQASKKEEDTWEMKCPYKDGDKTWVIYSYGDVDSSFWFHSLEDNARFQSGNIFPTKEAAELEAKRRKLLTRFRAFRDECNGNWKPDYENSENNYFLRDYEDKIVVDYICWANLFVLFGYFKNREDAERAIELFGDEIKELFVEKRLANENN